MLLFYIRHGDPIYAPDQLTPLGKRQAEAVAKRLARYGVDHIFASTSTRAIQTAQPTAELLKKDVTLLDWCRESHAHRDFGVLNEKGIKRWCWEQPKYIDLFTTKEMRALGDKWYDHPALAEYRDQLKNGMERIQTEADAFLSSLGYEHDRENSRYRATRPNDERVALFAHEGFGVAFMSALLDIPYPMYATHFQMSHSCMSVIEFSNKNDAVIPNVLQYSNDSHLYHEGLPTNYKNKIRF